MAAPKRHPLTLRFADPDLETAFGRDDFVKSLRPFVLAYSARCRPGCSSVKRTEMRCE
jgi:hypothetical protein